MSEQIFCEKAKQMGTAMRVPPYPGPLGQRIQRSISKETWQAWLGHQTMLINEYRLSMMDPKAKAFLRTEMEKFLFGEGSQAPAGYVPLEPSVDEQKQGEGS